MPPRSSLTSSFSVTDANNEVVCPLKNNDGSNCRKRCLGVSASTAQLPPATSCLSAGHLPAVLSLSPPSGRPRAPPVERSMRPGNFHLHGLGFCFALLYSMPSFDHNLTMLSHRKSAIAPCRSTSDVRIRTTTSRSSRLPKRASC